MSARQSVVVVGGGVVGLSIAYELTARGYFVQVVDRGQLERSASWAGAGILPPASPHLARHSLDQLRALSYRLHRQWADQLLDETGIDNEYTASGGLYIARSAGERVALVGTRMQWEEELIQSESLSINELTQRFPTLSELAASTELQSAIYVPDEVQIRNPQHLAALRSACLRRDVQFTEAEVSGVSTDHARAITQLETEKGPIRGDVFCFTAGSWTAQLCQTFGTRIELLPIRGQMLLFKLPQPPFKCIINEGTRYLVPRRDGHVLAGSTEEEVGFDFSTTEEARRDLFSLAHSCCRQLNEQSLIRQWSGLRPAAFDGMPYIGPLPGLENGFVAAGHFRSGLFLSPGTAQLMSDLIQGVEPSIDPHPFRCGRG